jgi:hypothetical protein
MNVPRLISMLERFGHTLPVLVADLPDDDARWKPADGAWSILEIVCHLADEEVSDFRTRLRLTLESPETQWPPIDPPAWAIERRYNKQDLAVTTERFVRERQASGQWLRSLSAFDGDIAHVHPKFGAISAGQLLASWVAHDALHLRQIAKRLHQLAAEHGRPFDTAYAGDWSA